MKLAFRLLILLPFLLVLVLFELSNRQEVTLGLWPTDLTLQIPLSLAILAGIALGMVLGGLLVWITSLSRWRRARRAEDRARLLEARLSDMRTSLASHPATPPRLSIGTTDAR